MFNFLSKGRLRGKHCFVNGLGKYRFRKISLYVDKSDVCEHLNSTYLTLHALGSSSTGAIVRRLDSMPLSLVLQFELPGVNALHTDWTLQRLDRLLNALKEITTRQLKPYLSGHKKAFVCVTGNTCMRKCGDLI